MLESSATHQRRRAVPARPADRLVYFDPDPPHLKHARLEVATAAAALLVFGHASIITIPIIVVLARHPIGGKALPLRSFLLRVIITFFQSKSS